jgi:hypothetical protein
MWLDAVVELRMTEIGFCCAIWQWKANEAHWSM